ncbi:Dbl homology domain-containing protein [Hyaloraphidium curvatum]|nr:Dbl homology domain-containing protein [Hyaloraphidium curvatum]
MLAWQQILATEAGAELADLVPRLSVDPLTSSFPVFPMIPHFLDSLVGSLPHDAWDLVDGPGDGLGGSAEEGDPLAKLRDSKIRRDHVMKEIYETEVSYLGKLQIMDRVFRAQLRRILGEAGEPSIRRIFGGLDELLAIHTEFRSRLRSLCLSWTDESGVGDLFREFKPKLTQGYAVYIDNFQSCRDEMNNLDRTNSEYRQFTKDCMTSPETEKTNLAEFLLYPVQRTTRYTLLLKEMVKSTPKTHPDYASVLAAQKDMEEWTNRVNELKRLEEERTAMFQAFSQTENCPASLINFNRRLVFQADATDGKTGKPLHVFLFSDLIMVAKPIQKGGIWFLAAAGPAAEGDKLYKFVRWLDFRDFAVADDTLTKSNRAQIRLLLRYRRADNPMSVTTFPGAEEKPAQANETLAYTFGTDEERDKFVAALQSEMKRGKKI